MTANTPNPNKTTHKQQILTYLSTGATLTQLEALRLFQCMSLSQRIGELRRAGIPIQSRTVTTHTDKRVSEYWLNGDYLAMLKHTPSNA